MFRKNTNVRDIMNVRDDTNVYVDTNKKKNYFRKNFVLTRREIQKKADDEALDILTLTGVASSLSEDLVGESLTENALKSMREPHPIYQPQCQNP